MKQFWSLTLAVLPLAILPVHSLAASSPTPKITLTLEEPFTVADSELLATVIAEGQNLNAAEAAQQVNENLRWAEKKLAATPQIHWQLGNYQSQHLANDKGWQLRGVLQLRAAPDVLLPVLATLQSRLQLLSLQTQPSAASIRKAEALARKELLQRFRSEAQSACTDLGLRWGGIEQVTLRSLSTQPMPTFMGPALLASVPAPVGAGRAESQGSTTLDGVAFCQK